MKSKDNSYSVFLRNQISYDQDSDFTLTATTKLSEVVEDLPYGIFEKYRKGEETDAQVWNRIIEYQKDEIENSDGKYFVIGDEIAILSFGSMLDICLKASKKLSEKSI